MSRSDAHDLELAYRNLCDLVLDAGEDKPDRTDTGTRSMFGQTIRGPTRPFPLLTSKWVNFKAVKAELEWFLSGSTNVEDLHEYDVGIWDEWADEDGDVGPVYGHQWRCWTSGGPNVDQLGDVVRSLRDNPHSRRHVVSAWNPGDLDEMGLPPCHAMFQFYVRPLDRSERLQIGGDPSPPYHGYDSLDDAGVPEYELDCQLYQRSADLFIGVPYNIASYALLTRLVARAVSSFDEGPTLAPGDLVVSYGDAHVYHNHFEQVGVMLGRDPREAPELTVDWDATRILEPSDVDGLVDGVRLEGYDPHPYISAPVAS